MLFRIEIAENAQLGISGILDALEHISKSLVKENGFGFRVDDQLLEFFLAEFLVERYYDAYAAGNCQIGGCPLIAGISDDGDALAVKSQFHHGSSKSVDLLISFLVCDGLEGLSLNESLTESNVVAIQFNRSSEHMLQICDGSAGSVNVILIIALIYHVDKGFRLFHFHFFDFLIFHICLLYDMNRQLAHIFSHYNCAIKTLQFQENFLTKP